MFASMLKTILPVAALALSMNSASAAEFLNPVETEYSSHEVTAYSIEHSAHPVVAAWKAAQPKAILVALHGFGLHKYAFHQFAEQMKSRGMSTYALDVRGFGGWLSAGKYGKVDFQKTFDDLSLLIKTIHEEQPNTPVFLLGESMGGAIAMKFVSERPQLIDGLISSVPANDRFAKIRTALKIGSSFVMTGGRKINLKHVLVERVSGNAQLKRDWEADGQAKLRVKLGELVHLSEFMKEAGHSANRIGSMPVLVVQGELDRLVNPIGTKKIYDELQTSDKELLVVAHGEHLTFEEGQFSDSVLAQLEHWVFDHNKSQLLMAHSG